MPNIRTSAKIRDKRIPFAGLFLAAFFGLNSAGKAAESFAAVYPGPKGIEPSSRYRVSVQQGEKTADSFVYYSTPLDNDAPNAENIRNEVIEGINSRPELKDFYFNGKEADLDTEQSCSWTCFSFFGDIAVRVSTKSETIRSFAILPTSGGIEGIVEGNTLRFSLQKPHKLAIVINGDYLNPLFVFADAPERDIPDKNAPGTLVFKSSDDCSGMKERAKQASVLWFEPGVHRIGVAFEVYPNQTVYLAGGSYLLGTFHGMTASNVSFRGRGILAGDEISRAYVLSLKRERGYGSRSIDRMKYHAISMLAEGNKRSWNVYADHPGLGCDNLNIEGITIASPRQFFIRAAGVPITIHNVKMVGAWPYNTDGISGIGQAHTTVFDTFFHCNDDAIYVSPNYCHIHHCVFWQGNNGCVFQFHWGSSPQHEQGGYIHDCDIVHCGHVSEANNRMVVGSRKSGPGDIHDITFKNIRIEGPVWSLFRLETNGAGDLGSIYNITLENITVNGPVLNKSTILSSIGREDGESSASWIRDITLKNILINGHKMTKKDVLIGDFQVKDITIE